MAKTSEAKAIIVDHVDVDVNMSMSDDLRTIDLSIIIEINRFILTSTSPWHQMCQGYRGLFLP